MFFNIVFGDGTTPRFKKFPISEESIFTFLLIPETLFRFDPKDRLWSSKL